MGYSVHMQRQWHPSLQNQLRLMCIETFRVARGKQLGRRCVCRMRLVLEKGTSGKYQLFATCRCY